MFPAVVLACVFAGLSSVFSFFTLACSGRLVREFNEGMNVLHLVHNRYSARLGDLTESVDSALDTLVSLDADAAQNSDAEVHVCR